MIHILLASADARSTPVLGVLFLVQISFTSIFGATNFTLAFWCFSLALNIVATIVIVARLFVYRRRLSTVLGKGYVSQYTGIMSMVVESELLYTAFMILYIVPFVRGNSLTNVFVQGPALVQVRHIPIHCIYFELIHLFGTGCRRVNDRVPCCARQGLDEGYLRPDDHYPCSGQHDPAEQPLHASCRRFDDVQ